MFFSNTSMVSLPSKWFSSNNNSSIFDGPLKILGSLCSVLWLSCVKQPYNPYFSETQVSHFLLVPQLCCCSVAECVAMGCTCKQETAELPPQPTQRLTDLCVQAARAVHTAGMLQVSEGKQDSRLGFDFQAPPLPPIRVESRFLLFLHEVTETQLSTGSQFAAPGDPAVSIYLQQRFCHHCNWEGLLLAGWIHMMASLWSTWNDLCSCFV